MFVFVVVLVGWVLRGAIVSGLYGRQTTSGLCVGCVVLDLMVVG